MLEEVLDWKGDGLLFGVFIFIEDCVVVKGGFFFIFMLKKLFMFFVYGDGSFVCM